MLQLLHHNADHIHNTVLCTVLNNFSLKIFALISKTRANLKKISAYSGSATSIYPKIYLTRRAKIFLLTSVKSNLTYTQCTDVYSGQSTKPELCHKRQ